MLGSELLRFFGCLSLICGLISVFAFAQYGIRALFFRHSIFLLIFIVFCLSNVLAVFEIYNIFNQQGGTFTEGALNYFLFYLLGPIIFGYLLRYKFINAWPEYYRAEYLINLWLKRNYQPGKLDSPPPERATKALLGYLNTAKQAWGRGKKVNYKSNQVVISDKKIKAECPNCGAEITIDEQVVNLSNCYDCNCRLTFIDGQLLATGNEVENRSVVTVEQKILIIQATLLEAIAYRLAGDLVIAGDLLNDVISALKTAKQIGDDADDWNLTVSWLLFLAYFFRCDINICGLNFYEKNLDYLKECRIILEELEKQRDNYFCFLPSFSPVCWLNPSEAENNLKALESSYQTSFNGQSEDSLNDIIGERGVTC